MGKQVSEIKVIGKVGNIDGYRGYDGKYHVRLHQPDVKNPRTEKQTANRDAFSLASKLVPYIDSVLREVNMANGIAPTRHGKKVAKVKEHLSQLPEGQHLPADLPIVDAPAVDLHFKELTLTRTGASLTLHAAIDPRLAHRLFRCAAAILLYNPKRDEYRSAPYWQPALADLTLTIPTSWRKEDLQAVAYILLAFKKKAIAALPITIPPTAITLSALQYIEWSQLHTTPLLPTD